jgi:hypothetical protein
MSQVQVFNKVFAIQSFFSDTNSATSILSQGMSDLIVQKITEPGVKGRFFGLHPSSRTPIALRALEIGGGQGTPAIILTPGQFIEAKSMVGLEWGLPVGWLGGGFAQLIVADGPELFMGWPLVKSEVLLHRVRLVIASDVAGLTFYKVWPIMFPFPSGNPQIAAEPTKVVMRLRLNSLGAATPMRLVFKGNDAFDIGTAGLVAETTDLTSIDVTWPEAIGNLSASYPLIEIPAPALGGSLAEVALIDISGNGANGALVNSYVDIIRFGKI